MPPPERRRVALPPLPTPRACPVGSIASGFFAHLSLVLDGIIRCTDMQAVPVVRLTASRTTPNFYLERPKDDLWRYFFLPTSGASRVGAPLPPQTTDEMRRMWMRGPRSVFNYWAPRDKYGLPYSVESRRAGTLDERWFLRSRVRMHHYASRFVTLQPETWQEVAMARQRLLGGAAQRATALCVHMRGSDKRHAAKVRRRPACADARATPSQRLAIARVHVAGRAERVRRAHARVPPQLAERHGA